MTRSSRHGLHCITDILTSTLQGVPVFFPVGSLCSPLWFFPVWSCGLVPVGSSLWSSLCGPLLWACGCLSCGPPPVPLLWAPVACSGIDAAQGRSIPLQVAGCRFIIIRTGCPVTAQCRPSAKGHRSAARARQCPARPALQPLQASNGLSGYPRTTRPEKRAQRPV